MRRDLAPLTLCALLAAGAALAQETPPATVEGGTAQGWLEVARERTDLRFAWVLGEAGDGASGELLIVLTDRPLPAEALASAGRRDELAAADEVRSIVARVPEAAGEVEVWFHHPRLPRGISLRGLAHFVRESETAARLEGRLVLSGDGTAFEAWFSAPIVRGETATWPEIAAEERALPEDRSFEEILSDGDADEIATALDRGPDLTQVGSSGRSALVVAADAGNAVAIELLLAAGAPVDARADRAAMTALMLAAGRANPQAVAALLAAGANPKLRTSSGFTALMHAVIENRLENARLLLAAGADLDRDRETLVKLATEKGYAEMVALLAATPAAAPHE